jgi:hypothetical protein
MFDQSNLGFGAAYGTAKSGVGIMAMGVMRPDLIMKSVVPVIMAGIIGTLVHLICQFNIYRLLFRFYFFTLPLFTPTYYIYLPTLLIMPQSYAAIYGLVVGVLVTDGRK